MRDEEALKSLRVEGAAARAAGTGKLANPMYRVENMPVRFDAEFDVWEAKAKAWEAGWDAGAAKVPATPQRRRGDTNSSSNSQQ